MLQQDRQGLGLSRQPPFGSADYVTSIERFHALSVSCLVSAMDQKRELNGLKQGFVFKGFLQICDNASLHGA